MESTDYDKKTLITELVTGQDEDSDTDLDDQFSDDEVADDNADKNQYFHVVDAEPPTNYDDPYSTLPPKVTSRLDAIKVSNLNTVTSFLERRCELGCIQVQRRSAGVRQTYENGAHESSHFGCLLVLYLHRIQKAGRLRSTQRIFT